MSRDRSKLRLGFSTGTAVTAAARAALRFLVTGSLPSLVSVRLPLGWFLPVPVHDGCLVGGGARVSVVKDGGDDPDVTHRAELQATLKIRSTMGDASAQGRIPGGFDREERRVFAGIRLVGGLGVGTVTKPGLPVAVGEPAVNPVPRQMLVSNLKEELKRHGFFTQGPFEGARGREGGPLEADRVFWETVASGRPTIFLPFNEETRHPGELILDLEVAVPKGQELARQTLNGRLGITGGISILGTTGLVRPFSHQSYRETIQAALAVARANGCRTVVLSTGGKSEKLAAGILNDLPQESFVQIADFFSFALGEVMRMGFEKLVLSVFFGKALKMAQGHDYTHAHRVALDLVPLADMAREVGHDESFRRRLQSANTAREALSLLSSVDTGEMVRRIGQQVLGQALRKTQNRLALALLLFDYEGNLLLRMEKDPE